jgi:hypothetical protein
MKITILPEDLNEKSKKILTSEKSMIKSLSLDFHLNSLMVVYKDKEFTFFNFDKILTLDNRNFIFDTKLLENSVVINIQRYLTNEN